MNHFTEVLHNERAKYGKRMIEIISVELENKYGRNFNEKNIRRMVRFSQEFSDFNILPTLSAKLSWSHFIELFPLKSHVGAKLKPSHVRWA